ncbi:MAG TPA: L-dopachrome tautomerase-related protein [Steroidobacteraceae bacterium]|nr:L-dopachrome tautomerase-related protein [Steroidobacteraceae bacterium]
MHESSVEVSHRAHTSWRVERIAEFSGWPSGIAVSSHGRIFVSFPQANGQRSAATLCEVVDGYAIPFPFSGFTSIQGVRCSENDRIYALDIGATGASRCDPDRAALWVLDAHSGRAVQRHGFRSDVMFPSSYLIDLALGGAHGEVAYLLDSGPEAPNALIVLDLVSGNARRVLNDHLSMRASASLGRRGVVANGRPLQVRDARDHKQPVHFGAIGVALSSDNGTLFWSKPDMLYSVPTALLLDAGVSDSDLDAAINTWPIRHFSSDGLARDKDGHILLTDVTHNGVQRLSPLEGHYELLAADPRISWPDGIAVGPDGAIYVTSSQFHRSAPFNGGTDARRPPFGLFRLCSRGRCGLPV